jgi:hypothetical protein
VMMGPVLRILLAGLMLCFVHGRRAWGGTILALCAAWMEITYGWLMPKYSPRGTIEELSRWSQFGSTPKAVALGMLAHPLLILGNVARGTFVPLDRLFFLPVLDVWTVLPVLIPLAVHTSSSYDMQAHLQGAYATLFVPFFFAGLARTLSRPWFQRKLALNRFAFCFCILLLLINVKRLPLPDRWAGMASAHRGLSTINRHIDGYRVLAQGTIMPHLGWTAQVDMLGSPRQKPLDDYDLILLSATQRTWPLKQADVEAAIRLLSGTDRWQEVRLGCVECFFKVGDTNLQVAASLSHY